ncbi:hypothetical protein CR194_03740 [Salipaludibacillus keqinensis]|uniref:Uncharacterized protein n=1 Tax=Salipaludibacillus keqinensis TaxID=2045207 RepID=A0A323THP7_9BACI|nr:hypothetical protein [Salipaludibacillus keqinensis]PYZ94652.1 hypothetical protein CR194_03740 [Salipaludibacillus keqinensis]
MSSATVKLADIVKKQYSFKLKSYMGVFTTMIVLHGLAILFSLNGVGSMGTGMGSLSVNINYYSATIVVMFTMIWGFISAILISTKAYRYDDFSFVTNRLSSHLANGLFLLTMSVVGGLTAILSSFLLRVIVYLYHGSGFILADGIAQAPIEWVIGFIATTFNVLFLCVIGYFLGMIGQFHKSLKVVLPVAIIGLLFVNGGDGGAITQVVQFYFFESSFLLYSMKILLSISIVYVITVMSTKNMEVIR